VARQKETFEPEPSQSDIIEKDGTIYAEWYKGLPANMTSLSGKDSTVLGESRLPSPSSIHRPVSSPRLASSRSRKQRSSNRRTDHALSTFAEMLQKNSTLVGERRHGRDDA
jgi:hypothetical protein